MREIESQSDHMGEAVGERERERTVSQSDHMAEFSTNNLEPV